VHVLQTTALFNSFNHKRVTDGFAAEDSTLHLFKQKKRHKAFYFVGFRGTLSNPALLAGRLLIEDLGFIDEFTA